MEDRGVVSYQQAHFKDEADLPQIDKKDQSTYSDMFFVLYGFETYRVEIKKGRLEVQFAGIDRYFKGGGVIYYSGQDKKAGSLLFCVPRALSKEAKQIYAVFKKEYAKRPYQLN